MSLPRDEKTEATDAIRGYATQFALTANSILEGNSSDKTYVELFEDFLKVTANNNTVTAIQVKDRSGKISLTTKESCAMLNRWASQKDTIAKFQFWSTESPSNLTAKRDDCFIRWVGNTADLAALDRIVEVLRSFVEKKYKTDFPDLWRILQLDEFKEFFKRITWQLENDSFEYQFDSLCKTIEKMGLDSPTSLAFAFIGALACSSTSSDADARCWTREKLVEVSKGQEQYTVDIGEVKEIVQAKFANLESKVDAIDDKVNTLLESRSETSENVDAQLVARYRGWIEKITSSVSVSGWKPFGSWSHGSNEIDKFLLDESPRILVRNSGAAISMAEAIDCIRRELASGGASVRIVGLSGTGKTRFVQALFEQVEATTEEPLNTNLAIYTDLSYQPNPTPEAIAERLVLEDKRSILVVDNCGAALHTRLNEVVQSSQVDVLTIEYDVREDFAEGTSFYHIKETGNDVIEDFLHSRFETLSTADIGKVVQFSGGNFRVALSLASTATSKGQLAHLQDNELFSRLFDQGGQAESALLKFAEALSLVYSFDTKDTGANSELAWLASIADCSVTKLFGAVAELNDRGLLQRRGRWAAVLPHAIANRLARRAIKRLPLDRFLAEISKNPQLRIAISFSRRLGYLHDSLEAQSLVEKLIDQDGRFSDFSSLYGSESTLFRNLAAANQEAALANIERFVEQVTSSDHRRDVNEASTLLYYLAYDEVHFSKAFDLLVRLRKYDLHHNGNQDDVFDALRILFYPLGSGTIARPKAKHEKIESLLEGDGDDRMLAKTLLRAGLQTDNFENFFGYEFGAHSRGWGLHVGEDCEIEEWFLPLTKLAHDNGISNSTDSGEFRSIVADSFYGLFTNVGLAEECERLAVAFHRIDGWPKGWTAIKGILKWAKLDESQSKQLRRLAEQLQPISLSNKITARLLSQYSHCLKREDDLDPLAAEEEFAKEMKALGRNAGKQPELLIELLGQLVATNNQRFHSAFGEGVGETISDPRLVFDATDALPEEASNSGPVFYRGLIWAWSKQVEDEELATMMDYLLSHKFWSGCFPVFQASVRFDSSAFDRLLCSIKNRDADVWHFSMLWHHNFIKGFGADRFFKLLDEVRIHEKGDLVVADVLAMLTHERHELAAEFSEPVVEYSIGFLETIDLVALERTTRSTTAEFVRLFEHGVLDSASDDVALNILERLLNFHVHNRIHCDESTGGFLHYFFGRFASETLERIYSSDLETGRKKRTCRVKSYLNRAPAIDCCLPKSALIWIGKCEAKFSFLMSTVSLACPDEGQPSLMQHLVDFWPDKTQVIELLFKRLYPDGSWSGSLANMIRSRIQTIENLCSGFVGEDEQLLQEKAAAATADAAEREEEELDEHRLDNERFE